MADPKELVCVTGAGGYVASYIVKRLLEKGFRVWGMVRDPDMDSVFERIAHAYLIQTDLYVQEWTYSSKGALMLPLRDVLVFSTPPVPLLFDPYVEMVEPAIKGTINVLKSCVKAGVKKVVLTASSSAFRMRPDYSADIPLAETSWSSVEFCKKVKIMELEL
ncbi:hypothetical protein R1flu_017805 [Riccia fluitans]|uniref:NAD-dependent epimerase/dehydratase domain-containing protein n=1 Tax=Riccia fluitans TaxID=41844 RepID=A0ABD1ZE89_9MARC